MLTSLVMPHIQSLFSSFTKEAIILFITVIRGDMLLFFKAQFLELYSSLNFRVQHKNMNTNGYRTKRQLLRRGRKRQKTCCTRVV